MIEFQIVAIILYVLLIAAVVTGFVFWLRRMRRGKRSVAAPTASRPGSFNAPGANSGPVAPAGPVAVGSRADAVTGPSTAAEVPEEPRVGRDELFEMIDSLVEQYEEEIREMTPAQVKSKKASWEEIESLQRMTQLDFSEEIIERFWGYKKGTTPEIPNTKKLRLGRGVWFTTRHPEHGE